MKYSIITPCSYRDVHRIQELKRNLEAQDFKDFEWIVSCNDSDLDLGDSKLKSKVVHFKPYNVATARNAGLQIAKGRFVIFVDADDYLGPHALRRLDNVIQLCHDKKTLVYDLNVYKTYEPEKSFISSTEIGQHPKDYLPDQSIAKSKQVPLDRYFNYKDTGDSYNGWLKNRYWIFNDEHKYDDLDDELKVNGKVVPKRLIKEHQLTFNSRDYFYSNLCFMLLNLEYADGLVKLGDFNYIKVKHNDPVFDPSLSQIDVANRWRLWLQSCFHSILKLNDETLINDFTYHVISIIDRYFYKAVVDHRSDVVINLRLTLVELQKILQLVNFNVIQMLGRNADNRINSLERQILLSIKFGDFDKAVKLMKSIVIIRDLHQLYSRRGRGVTRDFYYLAQKLPVNPHVIFYESFLGRSFSDNPKYIYRYIQKHYPHKFLNVWSADAEHFTEVKNKLRDQPDTLVVKRWGFKYMRYLATAKYFVDNMRQPKWFIKRPGMRFLETWHGTPLKHLVFDMDNVASASHLYKQTFYHQSRQWDNLITANQFSYDIFSHAFMYPKTKMLKSGYPRNDILNSPNRSEIAKRIKRRLGIPLDKKVILYAPTWRDNQFFSPGHYKFKLHLNIAELKSQLSDDYVLILRTHYFISNHIDTSQFGNFVFNESNYDDIAELYLISDILITDYSSVFFDYAILHRPILYYVYDYDDYADVLRGFYLNMEKDLPGPLIKTSTGVLHAIQNIDNVKRRYSRRYRLFNQRFNAWDDGHASERAVDTLFKR